MRRPRTPLRAAALAAVLLLLAGPARPARAERAAGRAAPELHVVGATGGPAPGIGALRGRLLVLEFFRTECPHCREAVPHLSALAAARSDRGLSVIGLGFEEAAALEAFRRDLRAGYPVARVETETFRDYDVKGLPRAFLVSPEGVLLWAGHPSHLTLADVDRRLADTPPWPPLDAALEPAAALLRAGRFGEARTVLAGCLAADGAGADRGERARALAAWIPRFARAQQAVGAAALARGDAYEAWAAFDAAAGAAEGAALAEAERERTALLADPGRRAEVEAGRALEAARARWRAQGREEGLAALEAAARQHPGTVAGRAAAELAARLRARR